MSHPSTASSEADAVEQTLRDADGISDVCLDRFILCTFIILCAIVAIGFAYLGYIGANSKPWGGFSWYAQ